MLYVEYFTEFEIIEIIILPKKNLIMELQTENCSDFIHKSFLSLHNL